MFLPDLAGCRVAVTANFVEVFYFVHAEALCADEGHMIARAGVEPAPTGSSQMIEVWVLMTKSNGHLL